jgi:deazaflavin-dependent oxidoreductase (nitroreductase family)
LGPVSDLGDLSNEAFCYLTTIGRVSGNPHEIEIWFASRGSTIYMLSGGGTRSDWVKNILSTPEVKVRIGALELGGTGRTVEDPDEDAWARAALLEKYNPTYSGDLTEWSRTALPIAVDIRGSA